ncbi:MAG: HAMP domain-containing protein [Verrucomicrobiota bacterium]|nr:HAMP domain-containing protein [Verrucomicrobiota bacterium]
MKIRTRLFLFLLPILISGITLVATLLSYKLYNEIVESFRGRLKAAVVSTAALAREEMADVELSRLRESLQITSLSFIPLKSIPAHINPSRVYITPVYPSETGKQMTGYAPLLDAQGFVRGMIVADANADLINHKFLHSLFLIVTSAVGIIALLVATLYYIANKISRPVQTLNNSALAIAAGQYGESVATSGPQEIVELSNTLNTMSECLLENINRLKENSLLRERMYGEYECAMLLQHLMLQKNIDNCRSDAVAVKSITLFSDSPRGLLLDFPKPDQSHLFHIRLAEADTPSFEGMYELLTQYKHAKECPTHTTLTFDRSTSTLSTQGPLTPLFWSVAGQRLLPLKDHSIPLESGDFFFLFNQGLLNFLKDPQELLTKVLKVFAQDGLETTASMLHKELLFASKRKELLEDMHLLCFQILNP